MMSDFARVVRHWSKETMMMMRCEFKEEEGGEEEQRERERENNNENNNNNNNLLLLVRDPQHAVLGRLFVPHLKVGESGMEYTVTSEDIYLSHQILYGTVIIYTRRGRHDAWKESKRRNKPLFIMCTSVRRDGPRCS